MTHPELLLTQDDHDLVLLLAGGSGCSLESAPGDKDNWVEANGGLPDYICKIAKAVMKSGKAKGQAIAIAVSRVKAWAAGGSDVDADTRAKAAKAAAQWAALKAKNAAKKVNLASTAGGNKYLMFSNTTSFNTDIVRQAYNERERSARQAARAASRSLGRDDYSEMDAVPYTYIKELWTDHAIVEIEGGNEVFQKVPYSVSDDYVVTFGEPVEIKRVWVEDSEELSDYEMALLSNVISPKQGPLTAAQRIAELSSTLQR